MRHIKYLILLCLLLLFGISCSYENNNKNINQDITQKDLYKLSLESHINFGVIDELYNSSKKMTMTITNEGIFAVPINLPSLSNSDFKITSKDNFNNPLQPGEKYILDINYIPTELGEKIEFLKMSNFVKLPKGGYNEVTTGSGSLYGKDVKDATYISNHDNKTEFNGDVKLTASYKDNRRPELKLIGLTNNIDTIDFGNSNIGNSYSKQLTLTNIGNSNINISSLELVSYNNSFSLSNNLNQIKTIKPQESVIININAIINHIGSDHAYLVIKSNDYYNPVITVKLLIQSLSDIILLEPVYIDFGSISINPTKEIIKTVKLTNKSKDNYNISSLNISGDGFYLEDTTCTDMLPSSSFCEINIGFKPMISKHYNGFINIIGTANESHNINISLMGIGINPILTAITNVNMGIHNVGEKELLKYIDITNTGSDALIITDILLNDNTNFRINKDNCIKSIQPGKTCQLPIYFKPQKYGIIETDLNIFSNDKLEQHNIHITGIGSGSYLSVENDIYFGQSDTVITRDITFTNAGYDDIYFNSINFIFNKDFKIVNNKCSSISKGKSCNITVEFNPVYMQASSDILDISYNNHLKYSIHVSGKGVMPVLNVIPNTTDIDFGNIAINQPKKYNIIVKNDGLQVPLELSLFSITGNKFKIKNNNCIQSVNVGASCEIELEALSSEIGSAEAILSFITNDPSKERYDVNLIGEFVNSIFTTNTNSINFGEILVGKEVTQVLSILNTGLAGDIYIENVESDNELFLIDNQCQNYVTKALVPGAYCNIIIKTTPTTKGLTEGNIIITTNSSLEPVKSVPVSVTGISSEYSLNLSTISFGSLNYNTQGTTKTVTFKNTGTEPLNIKSISTATPYQIVNNNCTGKLINTEQVCTFGVNIQTDRVGSITDTVEVIATSVSNPKKNISLSAKVPRYEKNTAGTYNVKIQAGNYRITLHSGGSGGGGGGGGGYDPVGTGEFAGGNGSNGEKGGSTYIYGIANIDAPNPGAGGAGGRGNNSGNGGPAGDANICTSGLFAIEERTQGGAAGCCASDDRTSSGGAGGKAGYCYTTITTNINNNAYVIFIGDAGNGGNGGNSRNATGADGGNYNINGGNGGNGGNGQGHGYGAGGAGGYPGYILIEAL